MLKTRKSLYLESLLRCGGLKVGQRPDLAQWSQRHCQYQFFWMLHRYDGQIFLFGVGYTSWSTLRSVVTFSNTLGCALGHSGMDLVLLAPKVKVKNQNDRHCSATQCCFAYINIQFILLWAWL